MIRKRWRYFGVVTVFTLCFFVVFSCYTLPKAHASFTGTAAHVIRAGSRGLAATAMNTLAQGGKAAIFGWRLASIPGIIYLLYESGALGAIYSWWAGPGTQPPPTQTSSGNLGPSGTWAINYLGQLPGPQYQLEFKYNLTGSPPNQNFASGYFTPDQYSSTWAAFQAMLASNGRTITSGAPTIPTTPTDPGSNLAGAAPTFPADSVWGTPGAIDYLPTISGSPGELVGVNTDLTDAQAAELEEKLGLTPINVAAGTQSAPDNVTGDTAVLQQRLNEQLGALLEGNKKLTSIDGKVATSANQLTEIGKLDNIVTALGLNTQAANAVNSKMDNVVSAINLQTQAVQAQAGDLDNVAIAVQGLSQAAATEGSVQTRINDLKTLAATKFPFSLASAFTVTVPEGGSHSLGSWKLNDSEESTRVTIDPMAGTLGSTFIWIRQLLVYMLWTLTGFGMIKRVTNL